MQRFGRVHRPGLKGSTNFSLLGGVSDVLEVTPTGVLLPDNANLTVSDYDLIQQRTSSTLEFRRSVGAGAGGLNPQYASPGSKVSFITDSTSLDLELEWGNEYYFAGNYAVGNVLVNGVSIGTFAPSSTPPVTTTPTFTLAAGVKTVTIVWPIAATLRLKKVTVAAGSQIGPATVPSTVLGLAGDSMTQGDQATGIIKIYAYLAAESLGWQQLNVAYGYAKVNASDGTDAFTGKSGIAVITYLIGYNDWTNNTGAATYGSRLASWIQNVRAVQPNVKILCISPLYQTVGSGSIPLQDYRNKMKEVVDARIVAADHQMFYLDGLAAMTNNANRLADGFHPNDLGMSEVSASIVSRINEAPASQPTGLTATASSGQVALSWSVAGTYTGTIIERRSPAGSGSYAYLATVVAGTTTYNDTSVSGSTQYEYRVKAYSMGGESAYSAAASATTPSGPPVAAWTLDFSSGTPSGYTLTRASTGTYVDSSGYIASASTNVARLTHNSSGQRLGLLVEGQRTNLALRSEEFDNATWLKYEASVTANSIAAPDNTTTADSLVETSLNESHLVYQEFLSQTKDAEYTFSVFVKKGGRDYVALYWNFDAIAVRRVMVNLTNGTISDAGSPSGLAPVSASETVTDVGNGWYRVAITAKASNASGTNSAFILIAASDRSTFTGALQFGAGFPQYSGNTGIVAVYMWGAQWEKAGTASSYIPTVGSSVTRSADIAYVATANVTNWGRPGSFVVEYYKPLEQSGGVVVADDDDVGNAGRLGVEYSAGGPRIVYGTSSAGSGGTDSAGLNKIGWAWNGSGAATRSALNGSALDTSLATSFDPTLTDGINLGGNIDWTAFPLTVSGQPNVVIRKVQFWNSQLSAADLNTLTT